MAGKKGQKILKKHEDSPRFPEYYKKLYPDWTEQQCIDKASWFKRSCNYQCIEYYENLYPGHTNDEYIKMRKDAIYNKQKNNPLKIEYYIKRYPDLPLEEQKKLHKKYTSKMNFQCIEYYTLRYPELSLDDCEQLRKEAIKKYTDARDMTGENNGMHHSRTTKQQRRSISPRCIEFYETKYPELTHEEHEQLRQNFFEKNRQKVKNAIKPTNIEYYLQQGLTEEEAKLALANRQTTFSLDKCIKKYGKEAGLKRFKERQEKWVKSLYKSFSINGDSRSVQSKFAKDIINAICKYLHIDYPKKEKYIWDIKNTTAYAYDFCYKNKLIEINGDYWHCNPNKYEESYFHVVKKQTAKEIWDYDVQKIQCANKYGYKVLTVWESEYNDDPIQVFNKCINFLNENN